MTRRSAILVGIGGVAVGLAAMWADYRFAGAADWVPDLLTGWTLIAAGLV